MREVNLKDLAALRWKNLNVLSADGYDGLVLMGQTEDGCSYWNMCKLEPGIPTSLLCAKLNNALEALKFKAVRHRDEAMPISEKDFYDIKIYYEQESIVFTPKFVPALIPS